jgi:hypothetical protein
VKSDYFSIFLMLFLILKKNINQLEMKSFFENLELPLSSKRNFYINAAFLAFITGIQVPSIQMVEFMLNSELEDIYNRSQLNLLLVRKLQFLALLY